MKYTSRRLLTLAAASALSIAAWGQANIKNAIADFNDQKYEASIAQLEEVVQKNDRDPKANYYLGASYVATRSNLSEGIRRLKYAQVKGVVLDSYLYLGRAYQLIFEFEQAKASLDKYIKTSKDTKKTELAQQYRAECESSIPLASKLFAVRVIDKYRIPADSLLSVYRPSKEVGQVLHNSDFFESDIDPNGILYRTERGDEVFFSMPDGNNLEKLYKIERLLDGWGDMTPLRGLASDNNERTPVMMTDGTTLYFASDRPGGMGGFDIYRSTYDSESRTFTQPVNLGVPFNSAFDDFLFVGDEFRQKAWFTSNRETQNDSLMVYEILWDESVIRNFAQNTDEIRRASALAIDPSLSKMRDDVDSDDNTSKRGYSITKEMKKFQFEVNDSLTYTQWEHFRSDKARASYQRAYAKQQHRDSLSAEMAMKRKEFMQMETDEERNAKISEILKIERELYSTEDELTDNYDDARKLENACIAEQIANGEYIPLKQIKPKKKAIVFEWDKLLIADNFEMYSAASFEAERDKYADFYPTVFTESELDDLYTADSLYAWAGILKMEAVKLNEYAANDNEYTIIDEEGKRQKLSSGEIAARAEMLSLASAALFNKSLDSRYDIFDDRYETIVDDDSETDFEETDEMRSAAAHDFQLVAHTSVNDGTELYEKAAVMKRRGMDQFVQAMRRIAEHLTGSFPLPKKGIKSEPESVIYAMAKAEEQNSQRGDVVFTLKEEDLTEEENTTTAEQAPAEEPAQAEEPLAEEPAKEEQATEEATTTTATTDDATASPADGSPVYRIQLGVFRNTPNADKLSQLGATITRQHLADKGLTKYFCGAYSSYADAMEQLDKVKETGFSGAFVVAFMNGEQVKLAVAQKNEK